MDKRNKHREIEELLKTDFSTESTCKEKILKQLLLKVNSQYYISDKKEGFTMRKLFMKPVIITAMITLFAISFTMTSYGQDFYRAIKEVVVGEHAKYIVVEETGTPDLTIPDELKGKLYDKKGNLLEEFPINGDVYNQKGEKLLISVGVYDDEKGNQVKEVEALTNKEYQERQKGKMTTMTNPEEARPYLAFDFSLPGYLPEGYEFDRIQLFNDKNGKPVKNCEYAYVYFSNGDHDRDIYLQLRLMNEETAYTAGIRNAEEIVINGNKGVIGDGNIDLEINGVMYMFMACDSGIDKSQLIKMAESIQL